MNIPSIFIVIAAVILGFAFEVIYAWLDSKIVIRMEQGLWTLAWWLVIGMAICVSGAIPAGHPIPGRWIAFFVIAFLHIAMNTFEPGILTIKRRFPDEESDLSDRDVVKKGTEGSRVSKPEMQERDDRQQNG
jgi:hypothetical protein